MNIVTSTSVKENAFKIFVFFIILCPFSFLAPSPAGEGWGEGCTLTRHAEFISASVCFWVLPEVGLKVFPFTGLVWLCFSARHTEAPAEGSVAGLHVDSSLRSE